MQACAQAAASPQIKPEGAASWRSNFSWALGGNVAYAACQWGMIVALAKFASSYVVGQFSLGLAIATPVFMFTNLQLRAVQGTDASRRYKFGDYLGLRLTTTLIGLAAVAGMVLVGRYERGTGAIILAVALLKAIETLCDVFYGLFLLNDRLDQTAKSMICRGLLSVIAISAGIYVLRDLEKTLLVLAASWIVVLAGFDARRGMRFAAAPSGAGLPTFERWRGIRPTFDVGRQWSLARISLPLGFVMTLVSLNLSMPRYFVHASMGEHALGIFSALAYTTVAVATVADALGHSTIPHLSRLYAGGDIAGFRKSVLKLAAGGAGLSVAGLVVVRALGPWLLRVLFSAEYAQHDDVFLWLVAAAGIECVASLVHYGITSARWFGIQVPMFLLVVASNALACYWLVPSIGLTGAALALVVAAAVHLVASAGVLLHLCSGKQRNSKREEAAKIRLDNWEAGL